MMDTIGLIGLGRMGGGIARRLLKRGISVVGYNRTRAVAEALAGEGLNPVTSVEELVDTLPRPRTIWIMLPAGPPTERVIEKLALLLSPEDCLIDGGNADYRDSLRRSLRLEDLDIGFIDMGVSGGIWGEEEGFGLMFGASDEMAARILPIVRLLSPEKDRGWVHAGHPGAGHFVKMVHNAIEYGMMQAYAEGFELLRKKEQFAVDLEAVAKAWSSGTVIRSWLLELLASSLEKDQDLANVLPYVADSGEARWALREAIDLDVTAPVLASSLFERFSSRDDIEYGHRLLAIVREAFGGHAVKRTDG